MQVAPISLQHTNFKSNKRSIVNSEGKLLYKTTTYFFRDDFDWESFIRLIKYKYADVKKVNFIIEGCSNGAEAYTCLMKILTDMLPLETKKFLPIIAKDIDKENIIGAQNGDKIGITDNDLYNINYHTRGRLSDFMDFQKTQNPDYNIALAPKPSLREQVKFDLGNILYDIDSMPDKNNILLCRNFWIYLDEKTKQEVAYKLGKKFDSSSLVGIGCLDEDAKKALLQNGFVHTGIARVFTKPSFQDYKKQFYLYQ